MNIDWVGEIKDTKYRSSMSGGGGVSLVIAVFPSERALLDGCACPPVQYPFHPNMYRGCLCIHPAGTFWWNTLCLAAIYAASSFRHMVIPELIELLACMLVGQSTRWHILICLAQLRYQFISHMVIPELIELLTCMLVGHISYNMYFDRKYVRKFHLYVTCYIALHWK